MTDPVAAFVRAERDALLEAAPAPHAARLWHAARRRRAASLRRLTSVAGWLARIAIAAAALASFAAGQPAGYPLLLLLTVAIWLTRGACAPVPQASAKGTMP